MIIVEGLIGMERLRTPDNNILSKRGLLVFDVLEEAMIVVFVNDLVMVV